jgi:hypothetical protein
MAMPQPQPIGRLDFWPCRRPRSSRTHLASLTYNAHAPPNAVIRSPHTAIPARARDHLQRTRPPHELSFTTRPQDNKRPSLSWQGGAQSTICAREPALGSNHGLRPEMSPTRPRAIFATATRHPGEGLYHSHHVSWAATPAQLSPPTRHLLPDKGAGAPAHSYAPAPHSRQSALRRPNRTSQRGDRGRTPAHCSCRTPTMAGAQPAVLWPRSATCAATPGRHPARPPTGPQQPWSTSAPRWPDRIF